MASRKASTYKPAGVVRGFTLIEIVVVIGLIIAVFAFSFFFSVDEFRGDTFRNERDVIISTLQTARSQAMNNMCFGASCVGGVPHGVYFGVSGQYVLFQGTSYNAPGRDTTADEFIPAQNRSVIVTAPIGEVVFDPLSGESVVQTIHIAIAGQASDITIGTEGQIAWTN